MKIKIITLSVFFFSPLFWRGAGGEVAAQNISVNTTGAANSTSSMFEVIQPAGAASSSVGIFARHLGTAANAYAIWAEATGATNKYAIVVPSGGGNVGIGTTTPLQKLEVAGSAKVDNTIWAGGYYSTGAGNINTYAMEVGGPTANSTGAEAAIFFHHHSAIAHQLRYNGGTLYLEAAGNGYGTNTTPTFQVGGATYLAVNGGQAGVGTTTPKNADGWTKVLDVNGGATHAKSIVTTTNIETGVYSHESGFFGAPAGGIIATRSNHPLSFVTNATVKAIILANGNVGIGTTSPVNTLQVNGVVEAAYSNDNMVLLNAQTQNALKSGLAIGYNQTYNGIAMTNAGFLQAETQGSGYRSILINPIAGNVGIGTTAPAAHLEVRDATSGVNSLIVTKDFTGIPNTNAAFIGGTDFAYGNTGIYVAQKDALGFPSTTSYLLNVVNNTVSAFVVNGLGGVGIGTLTPANADGWTRVLDVNGGGTHAKSIVTTTNIETGVYSHESGMWGAPVGGIIATRSNHPLSFVTNAAVRATILASGNFGIGTTNPLSKLQVNASAGSSSIAGFVNNDYVSGVSGSGILINTGAASGNTYTVINAFSQGFLAWNNLILQSGGGNVGIGTTNPGYKLDVAGSLNATTFYCNTAFWCSDVRYKKDIFSLENSLDKVLKLQGVNYFWKTKEFPDKKFPDTKQIGFIAQEVEKIYPELVNTNENGYKSVDYSKFTPILLEAIKDLSAEVQRTKAEQQQLIDLLKLSVKLLAEENKTLKASAEARIAKLETAIQLLIQASKEEAKR